MLNESYKASQKLSERRSRFDDIAINYDHYRPGYPDELFEEIIELSQIEFDGNLLEIGTGSGKATVFLAKKGYSILCLEPSKNFIEIAQSKLQGYNVSFCQSLFEEWKSDQCFDLVFSAQSFHWVPQEISYKKTASVLNRKGHIALFWNMYMESASAFHQDLVEIYKKYSSALYIYNYSKDLITKRKLEIESSRYFKDVAVREFYWSLNYTKNEFIGFLDTFGVYSRLDATERETLYKEIGDLADKHGENIILNLASVLYFAQKTD